MRQVRRKYYTSFDEVAACARASKACSTWNATTDGS
jgi:hypothetical protein